MEQQGNGEREKKIDALLAEADHWLKEAERASDQEKTLTYCQKAISELLFAFLWAKGEPEAVNSSLTLLKLWEECVRLEPEILPLAANLRFFLEKEALSSAVDKDLLLDAANEVWDFIFGSLTE
ncbi:MAG: hypothetical protein GX081_11725 [Firmicutes bacterium]|nr:hypothetical protein [Bacillota bacterium]